MWRECFARCFGDLVKAKPGYPGYKKYRSLLTLPNYNPMNLLFSEVSQIVSLSLPLFSYFQILIAQIETYQMSYPIGNITVALFSKVYGILSRISSDGGTGDCNSLETPFCNIRTSCDDAAFFLFSFGIYYCCLWGL